MAFAVGAALPCLGLGAGAEPQPPPGRCRLVMPASRAAGRGRSATLATSRPPSPASATAAMRRGRVRAQAACSAWRRRWYSAWAEAPGVPCAHRCRRRAAAARCREGSRSGGSVVGLVGHAGQDRLDILAGERVDREAGGVVVLPAAAGSAPARCRDGGCWPSWASFRCCSAGGPLGTLPAGRVLLGCGRARELLLALGCPCRATGGGGAAAEAPCGCRWSRVRSATRCLWWTRSMAAVTRCQSARCRASCGTGPSARWGSLTP